VPPPATPQARRPVARLQQARQRAGTKDAGAGSGVDRRTPADRSLCASRTRRRRPLRRSRSRPARKPPFRGSRRPTRDAAASPYSRRASRWRSSSRRRGRFRQTTPCRLRASARSCLTPSRCRPRGAGPPHTGARDRNRTVARPARRPASSRHPRPPAAQGPLPRRAGSRVVARRHLPLSDWRTNVEGSEAFVLLSILATKYGGRAHSEECPPAARRSRPHGRAPLRPTRARARRPPRPQDRSSPPSSPQGPARV
jgi:hypothetical protein